VRFFIGLDLGQTSDFTALSVLERQEEGPPLALRQLARVRGRSYPKVVDDVACVVAKLDAHCERPRVEVAAGITMPTPLTVLVVDATGVGRAVVDLLARTPMPCRLLPVTITSGRAVTGDGAGGLHVPKRDLVGAAQLMLQSGRLVFSRELPLIDTLVKELDMFQVKISAAGNELFGTWREGQHDDLVFALSLACWAAENAIEPYTGPLVLNDWAQAHWPGGDEAKVEKPEDQRAALADLNVDLSGEWEDGADPWRR
jgi:hypothetical protein